MCVLEGCAAHSKRLWRHVARGGWVPAPGFARGLMVSRVCAHVVLATHDGR